MRTWVWTLLLLGIAVALAVFAREHAGNMVIVAPPYRIETSLAFAVTTLVVLFFVIYALLRLAGWTLGVGARMRAWREQRELVREHERLELGWVNLLQGHYVKAEQGFDQVAAVTRATERRVLARLSSARAAHAMKQYARADAALAAANTAAKDQPTLALAAACTSADILLAQGRPAEALAVLEPVRQGGARHVHVQRLLLRIYLALPDWSEALRLARGLARHQAADMDLGPTIELAAASGLRTASDEAARRTFWKSLKASERTMPEVALAAADVFADDAPMVRKVLQEALDRQLDARLLTAYSQCSVDEARIRLERAEGWLKQHPQHAELLRVLGSLCLRRQLWGPATTYLQRSLQFRDDPRTHALLGSLYDRLDQPEAATRHWRLATAAVVGLTVLDRDGALPAADTLGDPARLSAETFDLDEPVEPEAVAPPPAAIAAPEALDDYEVGAADAPPRLGDLEDAPLPGGPAGGMTDEPDAPGPGQGAR
ncbi:hypothetical protein FOZ76_20995 [Verticiella sediminum]|uniref:HemY N-terminal domain-containing protein n=1 Tax=Verticiella sediminum TaxID=1247510 RepID=A0A556ABM8_9BURK|nr:heme biosynthesis HemY N-terminal domain-containing protein [Verticiella sediminum]TSH90306.1 hypothetical protein FOZ76_20995 [Verticiella sediminum]